MRLAIHLELRGIRLDEDRELVLHCDPGADARRDCDVVVQLDVLERVDAVLSHRGFQEQKRRAAGPEAEDLLPLQHAPFEFVDLVAVHQHEAVRGGEATENRRLGRQVLFCT